MLKKQALFDFDTALSEVQGKLHGLGLTEISRRVKHIDDESCHEVILENQDGNRRLKVTGCPTPSWSHG